MVVLLSMYSNDKRPLLNFSTILMMYFLSHGGIPFPFKVYYSSSKPFNSSSTKPTTKESMLPGSHKSHKLKEPSMHSFWILWFWVYSVWVEDFSQILKFVSMVPCVSPNSFEKCLHIPLCSLKLPHPYLASSEWLPGRSRLIPGGGKTCLLVYSLMTGSLLTVFLNALHVVTMLWKRKASRVILVESIS